MMMRVMLMIDTMMIDTIILMIMISSLQHQYLNTHKSKSHGVRTEFKFHLRSEITLVPNTYEFIYDDIPAGSTIYFEKSDPYLSGKNEARFYLKENIIKSKWNIDSIQLIDKPIYLLSEEWKQPAIPSGMQAELKYSSIPNWIAKFNFNNWLERSNCYKVYELGPAENR